MEPMIRSALLAVSVLVSVPALLAGPVRADPPPALNDLVDAAAQRLQTADPVAASKWLSGGPITDPARVRQVLDMVVHGATSPEIALQLKLSVHTIDTYRSRIKSKIGAETTADLVKIAIRHGLVGG